MENLRETPSAEAVNNSVTGVLREAFIGTKRDFTKGSIPAARIILAIPMILEMSMESLFAIVDTFFVSRLGAESIAEGLAYFLMDAETCQAAGRHAGTWRDAAFTRNVVEQQWRDVFGCGDRSSA